MPFDYIPPELSAAIKTIQEYSKRLAIEKGENPSKIFAELVNTDQRVPLNWNGSGAYPYYKEYYANMVKKYIDRAEETGQNILVENRPLKISRNTLVQQFYQGGLYLVERLDPDGKYQHLRARLEFQRRKDGVMIFWKYKVASKASDIKYDGVIVEIDSSPRIKDELIEFLETGPDETKFEKSNLALSQEHQQWVKDICAGIPNIIVLVINSNRVVIAKSSFAAAAMKEKS